MIDSDTQRLKQSFTQASPINRDLGVIEAITHAGRVIMYVDRPGEYLDEHGRPVSDQQARMAGFDVDADQLKRRKLERMAQAHMKIDALWEAEREAIRRGDYTAPPAAPLQQTEPLPDPDKEFSRNLAAAS